MPMDAITLRGETKNFRKRSINAEYTSFKSVLVRWLRGRRERPRATLIQALNDIDLAVPKGSTLGLIGRHGSGKSTLLKLITGFYKPSSGTIEVSGRISALVDLGAGFHP